MFKLVKLKNGTDLILAPQKDAKSLTLLVLYKVGSRYEDEKIAGMSHFIEHMMFKGTKKRPTTLDISKELDGIGAEFNAFTSKDHTAYYIKADAEKLELALDVLSDMLTNSKFDAQELAMEKGVILEEKHMYEDNPLMHIEDLYEKLMYQSNKLGELIIGTENSIKATTRQTMLDYKNQFYRHNNSVIVVAGKITATTKKLVEKYFQEKTTAKKSEFAPFKITQNKPQIFLQQKKTEQIQLCLGFPTFSMSDPLYYAKFILAVILGGNMSSRLFINIREKKGLCYYIKCQPNFYEDTGNLMIQAGLDKTKIKEAIKAIINELKQIKEQGISAEELARAKDFIKGKTILQMEDSENMAQYFAKRHLLFGKIIDTNELLKKFMAVTKNDINKVAQQIIDSKRINLAMIGPETDKQKFLDLLNF